LLLDPDLLKKTGVFALVSAELITFIGGGYWLGSFVDGKWNSAPVFTVSLATIGLIYSVWRIFWLSKKWMQK
jgi:hypothetical protein